MCLPLEVVGTCAPSVRVCVPAAYVFVSLAPSKKTDHLVEVSTKVSGNFH